MVYPGFQKYTTMWWEKFLGYAFVAPAFFFMIYLSLTVLAQLNITDGSFSGALQAESSDTAAATVFLNYILVIGLLYASLMVAKQMGAAGAGQAMNIAKATGKKMRTTATTAALYAPRVGVRLGGVGVRLGTGAASSRMLKSFNKWQGKNPDDQSKKGKVARKILAGLNVDRGIVNTLEKGTNVKAGLHYSYKENADYEDERRRRLTAETAVQKRATAITEGVQASKIPVGPINPLAMKELSDAMRDLTEKQLTEDVELNVLTNENVAVHLSTKQIETLEKSGKYSDAEITNIKTARRDGFQNIATQTGGADSAYNTERSPEWLAQKGVDEISKMPMDVFTSEHMAPYLTPPMIEAKMKSGISKGEVKEIRDTINAEIVNDLGSIAGGSGYTRQWVKWTENNTYGGRLDLTTS